MNNILQGYKTYSAAAGLLGYAIYQFSQKNYDTAFLSLVSALGVVGIKVNMNFVMEFIKNTVPILSQIKNALLKVQTSIGDENNPPVEDKPPVKTSLSTKDHIIGASALSIALFSTSVGIPTFKSINPPTSPNPPPSSQPVQQQPVDSAKVLPDKISAELYKVIDFKANIPDGIPYKWVIRKQTGMEFRSSGLTGSIFPESIGTYFIYFSYGNPIDYSSCEITVTSGTSTIPPPVSSLPPTPVPSNPPSPPISIPNPNPPSPTVTGPLWIVVVYNPQNMSFNKLNEMYRYSPLVDEILSKGHSWKVIDSNGKDDKGNLVSEVSGAVEAARGKFLPWVFIVDQNPKEFVVRQSLPFPSSPAEMLSILTKK